MLPTETAAACVFTARHVVKYRVDVQGTPTPLVIHHAFVGVTHDRSLTLTPDVGRLKMELSAFVNILSHVSDTRWGAWAKSLLRLYDDLVFGLLR